MSLKKYCARSGCNVLVDITQRYCEKHSKSNAERNAEYDRTQRDKKSKAFYNSPEWEMTREAVLARDNNIDVFLYVYEDRVVPAKMVHHIVELREDYSLRCDMNNLISLSEETHEGIIKKEYKDKGKRQDMQKRLREAIVLYQKAMVGGVKKFL